MITELRQIGVRISLTEKSDAYPGRAVPAAADPGQRRRDAGAREPGAGPGHEAGLTRGQPGGGTGHGRVRGEAKARPRRGHGRVRG